MHYTNSFILRLAGPCLFGVLLLTLQPAAIRGAPLSATITITDDGTGDAMPPRFLGLSYESSIMLPRNGKYYFDAEDPSLVRIFRTLGIRSLRVGADGVDAPAVPVPQEKDIDALFAFARAAGVKVIYSFRLKDGNPREAARLATYIAAHYADGLHCFAIGNEPNDYIKTFEAYFAEWKPIYDAILQAVPTAKFDGPSGFAAERNFFPQKLAEAISADGHLAMISEHFYFFGNGRAGEKDPAGTRARVLSDAAHDAYARNFAVVGSKMRAKGIPYRIDEINSCYHGGAKGVSDTYAATLWALDCTHWWVRERILGLNYHTDESIAPDGRFVGPNYAAFLHAPDGKDFEMRPPSYGFLGFTQGSSGRPIQVSVTSAVDFDAYAYRAPDRSVNLTLINKTYGDHAIAVEAAITLPTGVTGTNAQRLDLVQQDSDVAAHTGITLGGAAFDPQGGWSGQWKTATTAADQPIRVAPASAAILHFAAAE